MRLLFVHTLASTLAVLATWGCSTSDDDGSGGASSTTGTGGDGDGTGAAAPIDCAASCQELGFVTGASDGGACVCDEPVDPDCYLGMTAVCTCNESINQPCTEGQAFDMYVDCHQGEGTQRALLLCVATYVEDQTIDCAAAAEGCT